MGFTRKKRTEAQWAATGPEVIRCSAHLKSDGTQCRWEAAPGTTVCNQHGALAPQVRARAATRIQMSVDDAVKRLLEMLDDPNTENRDKIKVLHDLLDRGGLGATEKVLVGVVTQDPVEKLFQDILSTPGMTGPTAPSPPALSDEEFKALNAKGFSEDEDIVDAEVVEDLIGDVEEAPAPRPTRQRPADRSPAKRKPPRDVPPPPHIRRDLERLGLL